MELALFLPVLLLSVVVHEYAHARAALAQGDRTALKAGRVTLNPLPHIDLVGSILFPLLLFATRAPFLFGWARPVPVDPRNFREYRRGDIIVSLAGVTANLGLAVAFTLAAVALARGARWMPALEVVGPMLEFGVLINLVLAFFNLIPIPPLDGSHVVYHLLPAPMARKYREAGRYGMLVLLAILFFAPGLVRVALWPVARLQDLSRTVVALWS